MGRPDVIRHGLFGRDNRLDRMSGTGMLGLDALRTVGFHAVKISDGIGAGRGRTSSHFWSSSIRPHGSHRHASGIDGQGRFGAIPRGGRLGRCGGCGGMMSRSIGCRVACGGRDVSHGRSGPYRQVLGSHGSLFLRQHGLAKTELAGTHGALGEPETRPGWRIRLFGGVGIVGIFVEEFLRRSVEVGHDALDSFSRCVWLMVGGILVWRIQRKIKETGQGEDLRIRSDRPYAPKAPVS